MSFKIAKHGEREKFFDQVFIIDRVDLETLHEEKDKKSQEHK